MRPVVELLCVNIKILLASHSIEIVEIQLPENVSWALT